MTWILLLFSLWTVNVDDNLNLITAALGRPIAWAYGTHVVGGNVILRDDTDPAYPVLFIALGDGEWDGYELDGGGKPKLYLNGSQLAAAEVHFHPGVLGALSSGGGLTPESTGGDNKVDLWFPTGGGIQPTTFSRTVYVAIKFNAAEVNPNGYNFRGLFRTRKVQWYDATGTPTVYEYTENPIRQAADLLTVVRGWPVAQIDWVSALACEAYCDALISIGGSNVKRFVCHKAWPDKTNLDQALEDVLGSCRGFLVENGDGKIGFRVDQARAAVFSFSRRNCRDFNFKQKDARGAANRLNLTFRDSANDFAEIPKTVDHEAQQTRTGRIIPADIALPGMPQHQAERIANYRLTTSIDLNELVTLRGMQDSLKLMPGDVVNVEEDSAPWDGQETFEVDECTDEPDGTRDFQLTLYRGATYSDAAGLGQNLQQTTINKRWSGVGGSTYGDTDVPPASLFGINSLAGDGSLVFSSIGFVGAPVNTNSIASLAFWVYYHDELLAVRAVLAADLDDHSTTIVVQTVSDFAGESAAGAGDGHVVFLGEERIRITSIVKGSPNDTWTVERGVLESPDQVGYPGYSKAAHLTGAPAHRADLRVFTFPLQPELFGHDDFLSRMPSMACSLPFARIGTILMSATNAFGLGPTANNDYLRGQLRAPGIYGLRTGGGDYVSWLTPGVLGVKTGAGGKQVAHMKASVRDLYIYVKTAPDGADLTVVLTVNGNPYLTAVIPDGSTESALVNGAAALPIEEGDELDYNITGAGSTFGGEDLGVRVRL